MNIATLKVLVQWLPSESLRLERQLTIGLKQSTEVQQDAVKLIFHPKLFPKAMALAERRPGGSMHLQVGFKGNTHFRGEGWVLAGLAEAAAGRKEIRHFTESPELEELVEVAWKDQVATLDKTQRKALETKLATLQKFSIKALQDQLDRVKRANDERLPSPYFNLEAFYSIAHIGPDCSDEEVKVIRKQLAAGVEADVSDG